MAEKGKQPANKAKQGEGLFGMFKLFAIGSMSGMIATSVIQPIDTVKVLIQNKGQSAGKNRTSISPFAVAKQVIKNDGVTGLYAGLDAALLRQLIYAGARLGIYKYFENTVKHQYDRNLHTWEKIAYSLMAGALGSFIANPTDLALIRFQSDKSSPPQQRRNYKHVGDALRRILKQEGVRGLWTGSSPTVTRAMAVNSSQLVSYNEAKQVAMKLTNEKKQTVPIRLLSSAISGVCVSVMALPFDNVKTKMMRMKKSADGKLPYNGFVDCFKKSIANEGVAGLWIGLPTFYLRIAPHAMITVLAQDFLHDIFSKKH